MAYSQESSVVQGTPSAAAVAKAYNGGLVSGIPGNNTFAINIAQSASGTQGSNSSGIYRISRATVVNNSVGAYAVLGTFVPGGAAGGCYAAGVYNDGTAVNGTTYSYTAALDNGS